MALEGQVVLPDGRPAGDATVSILGFPGSVRTDRDGRFKWSPDPEPPFEVLVVLAGGQYTAPVLVRKLPETGFLLIRVVPLLEQEVTVTSGATPNIESSPASGMTVVPREDILRRQGERLVQIVETVAGVSKASEGHAAVPAIRGLARGRTVILIDGARVTTERRAGPSASFLDPFSLQAVEISRGPGSVSYGSDAFGGVIDARTVDPEPEPELKFKFLGTQGWGIPEKSIRLQVSRGFSSGGLLVQTRFRQFDDYHGPAGLVTNTSARDHGLLLKGVVGLGSGRFSLTWQSDAARDVGRPRNGSSTRIFYPKEDSHRVTAAWDLDPPGLFSRLALQGFWGSYRLVTDRDELPSPSQPRRILRADVSARDFGVRAFGVLPLEGARLELGLDFNGRFGLKAEDSTRFFDKQDHPLLDSPQTTVENAGRIDLGVYLIGERELNSRFSLSGGLRLDRVTTANRGGAFGSRSTKNAAASGFLSLSTRILKALTLIGQVSRGFRDPTLSDRYFSGISGRGFVTGNPNLLSERSLQFDLSLRFTGSKGRLAFYAYRYRIDDLVERFEFEIDRFTFRNRGEARVRGIEVEALGFLSSSLTLEVSAHRVRGEAFQPSSNLDDIPADRIFLRLQKSLAERGYTYVQGTLFGKDSLPGPTESVVAGYGLLDLGGGWRFKPDLQLRVQLRNLLDKTHPISPDSRAVTAPGRSFSVTLAAGL